LLDEQIAPFQAKYDKALELAGVKMVRLVLVSVKLLKLAIGLVRKNRWQNRYRAV
jgi:hypothetical protein